MIKLVTMYSIVCDRCGKTFCEGDTTITGADKKSARGYALESGWVDQAGLNFKALFEGQYRIKPEPTYRPFANVEECWNEMQKHQPFGWLKSKYDGHLTLITVVDNEDMMALSGNSGWDFLGILKTYTFADRTPFGIVEEE